jgi:hypothetical protein
MAHIRVIYGLYTDYLRSIYTLKRYSGNFYRVKQGMADSVVSPVGRGLNDKWSEDGRPHSIH